MLHLSSFSTIFESDSLTPEQIEFLNRYVDGEWVLNLSTGLVDVKGDVYFPEKRIKYLPARFGLVSGCFYCQYNLLTSLEGAPLEVGGMFDCSNNLLTSLKGSPLKTGGSFVCSRNFLTSLEGASKNVGFGFDCAGNLLNSLEGAPEKIERKFSCDYFEISEGKWGIEGWLEVLATGSEEARSLILSILNPSYINSQIQKDPEGMMMKLKGVWNSSLFTSIRKEIVIPSRYREEMDTLGDLEELGF